MSGKKIVNVILSVLLSLLILLSVLGMVFFGIGMKNAGQTGTFSLFGYSFHLNKSTAMEPALLRNDLIVVKHDNFSEIHPNDLAAFYYQEDEKEHLLIRRVAAVDGLTYTVEDLNGNQMKISAENSRFLGKAISRSPQLGRAVLFLQTEDGRMIFLGWTIGAAMFLIGMTILVHLIWKMLHCQNLEPVDTITGETLKFDDPF